MIDELLDEWNSRHDYFQITHFITRMEGGRTPYGLYRQALRSFASSASALREMKCSIDLMEIDVEELRIHISLNVNDSLQRNRDQINHRSKTGQLYVLKKKFKMREREVAHHLAHVVELKRRLGDGDRTKMIEEMWIDRILGEGAMDCWRDGKVGAQSWKHAAALPPEAKEKVFALFQDPEQLKELALISPPEIEVQPKLEDVRRWLDGSDIYGSSKALSSAEGSPESNGLESGADTGQPTEFALHGSRSTTDL